jgi:sensor histidine kinase regulating citrate/malate metabolism
MMKVTSLKRLESSVKSLAITMGRTITEIEDLEERLSAHQKLRDGKAPSKAVKSNTDFDLIT